MATQGRNKAWNDKGGIILTKVVPIARAINYAALDKALVGVGGGTSHQLGPNSSIFITEKGQKPKKLSFLSFSSVIRLGDQSV